ncbi:MAG: DUF1003 domain-containing protein [Candidatus Acidiferrum sp.]|jgi:uncharacterized membrane protein
MSHAPILPTAHPSKFNIQEIAKLEQEALARRTITEKFSDAVVKAVGNTFFLLLNLALVLGWLTMNLGLFSSAPVFDPFPFGILALVVSSESVFLTIFVLISQNRMARAAERRSHLDLQVGMLAEQELTTMIQMLQSLCEHAGVDVKSSGQQLEEFKDATDVRKLATELEEKLPET